jgi:tyrosinase
MLILPGNIDRLLAMWQAINPGSYVVQINSEEGTYTWAVNFPENEETPLTPFHRTAQGQFWKSVDVVKTETFQYAYPETQEWAFSDNQAYQSSVRTAIKNLYGGSSPSALFESKVVLSPTRHSLAASKAKASSPAQKANPAPKEDAPAPKANPAPKQELKRDVPTSGGKKLTLPESLPLTPIDTNELSSLAPNGKYTEWIANIRAEKHALGGPYGVHVFLGDFNEDERTWPFEHNLVGTSSIFCRAAGTDCGKCKDDREAGLMVTGIVPLTFALIEDVREGLLRSLNAEDVVPYLTRNLHWRVTLVRFSHCKRQRVSCFPFTDRSC